MFVSTSPNDRGACILHADLDAFFASVHQRDDPTLRGLPVIVGPGVVLAASYAAKRRGVRTAMGVGTALRLCPEAIVVPPRFAAYTRASKDVFAVFRDTTPIVEGISIDEAFLDVGGLRRSRGDPVAIAAALRARVAAEVGLDITVGVARTKFLAKVASGVAKPNGLLLVEPDRELEFLHPLPIERLWGVGTKTADKLHRIGLRTVGDVARIDEVTLVSLLGPAAGRHLHGLAVGHDPRQVVTGRGRRSVGAQRALGRGRRSAEDIDAVITGLVERVTGRMRDGGHRGRTVVLRLRFDDYTRVTRSRTLPDPTARTADVLNAARRLVAASWSMICDRGITLVGIAVTNLGATADQLELPFAADPSTPNAIYPGAISPDNPFPDAISLEDTLDAIRRRFGSQAVTRTRLLGRRPHETLTSTAHDLAGTERAGPKRASTERATTELAGRRPGAHRAVRP